jgi:hypothetical protein
MDSKPVKLSRDEMLSKCQECKIEERLYSYEPTRTQKEYRENAGSDEVTKVVTTERYKDKATQDTICIRNIIAERGKPPIIRVSILVDRGITYVVKRSI